MLSVLVLSVLSSLFPSPSSVPTKQDPTWRFYPKERDISVTGVNLQDCWTWDVIEAARGSVY